MLHTMYKNTYANGTTLMRQRLYILLILRKKCFSVLNNLEINQSFFRFKFAFD